MLMERGLHRDRTYPDLGCYFGQLKDGERSCRAGIQFRRARQEPLGHVRCQSSLAAPLILRHSPPIAQSLSDRKAFDSREIRFYVNRIPLRLT